MPPAPAPQASPTDWSDELDAHAEAHGFHAYLSARHGALFTEAKRSLLVTFEEAGAIRARASKLPFGLDPAGKLGWSHLGLYSEGDTWFRDPGVYALFDDLVDDGFFDRFDRVMFYGAGAGGYAATAFSAAAPGAEVLALRPQATLSASIASWDDRHHCARRLDFEDRYGYGPDMIRPAALVTLVMDPIVRLDAMHAALFTGSNVQMLRARHFGPVLEHELEAMGVLSPMVQAAAQGRLTPEHFSALMRQRHRHAAYLRAVLDHLEAQARPGLAQQWCRAVLQFSGRARFQTGLAKAQDALAARAKG